MIAHLPRFVAGSSPRLGALACLFLFATGSPLARAHLMPADHGTLNVVGSGAFLVLSVPVGALDRVDDDRDGYLSAREFAAHETAIRESVVERVALHDGSEVRSLEHVMLAPVHTGHATDQPASHVVVMGRFAIEEGDGPLRLDVDLFDPTSAVLVLRATRRSTDDQQVVSMTPTSASAMLFR